MILGQSIVSLVFNFWILIIEICFVLTIVISIERYKALRKLKFDAKKFLGKIKENLKKGGIKEALTVCEMEKHPLSNVIAEGLRSATLGRDDVYDAIEEAVIVERSNMEKRVGMLSTIAFIAPLLGLLGTVIGIIQAFGAMATRGADPTAMLTGVATALITTAVGIITAVPAAIAFGMFSGRIDSTVGELESGGKDLVVSLSEYVWTKRKIKKEEKKK